MPILGITSSGITRSKISTNSYESIQTVTVGSGGQNNIEFTSIPDTYTHLQIRYVARASTGDTGNSIAFGTRFNSDTGNNYSYHRMYAAGTTGGVTPSADGGDGSEMYFAGWAGSGTASNTFGVGVIDILDYANTNKYKTIRGIGGCSGESGSGGFTQWGSGHWRNTNKISSIQISGGSFYYAQHSKFALYGIKEKV
jgi:hypothetical protein